MTAKRHLALASNALILFLLTLYYMLALLFLDFALLMLLLGQTLMKGGWQEGVEMLQFLASKGYVCSACGTTWPLGMEQGLPIDFEEWTKHIYHQKFEHRGANHGQWDDIVCVADGARRFLPA